MHDTMKQGPNFQCLFQTATGQHGYFTRAQADICGYRTDLLSRLTRSGKFARVHWGVYRLRDYPSYPREEVVAAWLAKGREVAVVSHESALDLHDLSDVIPSAVHLTVPRSARYRTNPPGVKIHTTKREFGPGDVVTRDGMRVTSVARTIADAAEAGTGPEQVELAVQQALHQGLTSRLRLEQAIAHRSRRVQNLINGAMDQAPHEI
jgi:predicted transcriptional regulator of viral defense system